MSQPEQIEQELAKAATGLREGNNGLARVCARRAVAFGAQTWVKRNRREAPAQDAMSHLRMIHQEETFPLKIREAAQRLLSNVTERDQTLLSTDPIADARLILTHLEQPS